MKPAQEDIAPKLVLSPILPWHQAAYNLSYWYCFSLLINLAFSHPPGVSFIEEG